MTPLLSSIDRINAAMEAALTQPPPPTGTLRVCHATEDEWNAFADSEDPIVRLNYLEWFPDTEEIHIIEFADAPHEEYVEELNDQFRKRHVKRWLKGHMAAKNSQGRRWCPDLSYGPHEDTPHSVLPPKIPIFADFRTIKVEIGVSQQWGMAPGELDHKAIAIWAVMPGVEYVLCVKFEPDFTNAEYKLYDARVNPLVQLTPLPIIAPSTVIQLDGRRILGIPPGMALPTDAHSYDAWVAASMTTLKTADEIRVVMDALNLGTTFLQYVVQSIERDVPYLAHFYKDIDLIFKCSKVSYASLASEKNGLEAGLQKVLREAEASVPDDADKESMTVYNDTLMRFCKDVKLELYALQDLLDKLDTAKAHFLKYFEEEDSEEELDVLLSHIANFTSEYCREHDKYLANVKKDGNLCSKLSDVNCQGGGGA